MANSFKLIIVYIKAKEGKKNNQIIMHRGLPPSGNVKL